MVDLVEMYQSISIVMNPQKLNHGQSIKHGSIFRETTSVVPRGQLAGYINTLPKSLFVSHAFQLRQQSSTIFFDVSVSIYGNISFKLPDLSGYDFPSNIHKPNVFMNH